MAVRWYLPPSGGTPGITPTPSTEWEFTTGFGRVVPSLTKTNTLPANQTIADTTATLARDALGKQFVYPLPVGTVFTTSQTFKGQVMFSEAATGNNLRSQMLVRVIASDGSTVRSVLYAGQLDGVSGNPTNEFGTTIQNREIPAAAPVNCAANYTSVAGDYLIIEVGYRKHAAASTTGTLRLMDNNATDLADGGNSGTTDGNSYFEWSGNFSTTHQGSAAIALGTLNMAGAGVVRKPGAASIALGTLNLSANGQIAVPTLKGSVSISLGSLGLSAAGVVRKQGVSAIALGSMVLTTVGQVRKLGSGSIALGTLNVASTGQVRKPSSAAIPLGSLILGSTGQVRKQGSSAIPLGTLNLSASGIVSQPGGTIQGSASIDLGSLQLDVVGRLIIPGSAAIVLGATQLGASGQLRKQGALVIPLGSLDLQATSRMTVSGSVSILLGAIEVSASGRMMLQAAATIPLGSIEVTADLLGYIILPVILSDEMVQGGIGGRYQIRNIDPNPARTAPPARRSDPPRRPRYGG